ncbi:hypothetical protein ERO13_A11G260100v2 [Gossypium hirsutum]|uniref:Ribose-phosphate pyrophosphokinase 1 n=1 Tax=Gossypium hirsutum TaxID=3635 RepID=A0A1U8HP68_GOSHI|nr:ribose-phosphate pyrophosphokinase 1-like [Gossypium hirsutum]KAG4176665.1 hypothetical protein ERO13_A11G260100v2 [Gossypium hirsutum]
MEGLVAFSHTSNTCPPCLCDCSSQPLLTMPEDIPRSGSPPFFSQLRYLRRLTQRCSMVEPLKFENGKPHFPLLASDPAFPTFLSPNSHFQNDINKHDTRLCIFSGTANPALAQEIACYMGLELGKIKIKRFADGEIYVQLQESVKGCDLFLVQPTCPPANENLMELLIMIDWII